LTFALFIIVFKNRYILAATTVSIIALQVMLWLLILKAKSLPSEVVLWYTLPVTQRLAPISYLWLIPATALVSWIINLALGWYLFQRYPATTKLLATVATTICLLGAISIAKTILIYTSLI
jgi:hypothetical protein